MPWRLQRCSRAPRIRRDLGDPAYRSHDGRWGTRPRV